MTRCKSEDILQIFGWYIPQDGNINLDLSPLKDLTEKTVIFTEASLARKYSSLILFLVSTSDL